jgi:hypothetical protein
MDSLVDVTKRLGKKYKLWKSNETKKNDDKETFFKLANEEVAARGLSRKSVSIYGPGQDEARTRCQEYYPIFREIAVSESGDGYFDFVLEELAEFKPYTYVNPEDRQVYGRRIQSGPTTLDDERLQQEDPELYKRVTETETKRVLKDIKKLSPEDLAAVGEYIYEAKPKVQLAPPRPAKPEELEDAG